VEVHVQPTDTIGSLKKWLEKRNYYSSLTLRNGSTRLKYDFLAFAEYDIQRDNTVLHAFGVPNGARSIDVASVTEIRDRTAIREVEDLRSQPSLQPHRHFGEDFVRYIAHDYRDSFGGGTVLTVQNRTEVEPRDCRVRDEMHLSPSQKHEVKRIREEHAFRQRLEHRDRVLLENGRQRIELRGIHQHHSSRAINSLLPGSAWA